MEKSHSQSLGLLFGSAVTCAFLVVLIAVFIDASFLFQSDVAVGIDGYYYVLQIQTFLREGRFYFSTPTPIVLLLLSGIGALTGDSVLSVKIGAILLHACLCLGVFAFATTIARSGWIALAGMSIAAFSGVHFYFIGEFINSLGSLVFLVWGAVAFVRYWHTRRVRWLILALALIACSVFSHRAAIGVIAVIFVAVLFSIALHRAENASRLWVIVLLGIIATLPIALYWQPFWVLPVELRSEILPNPQNPLRSLLLPECLMLIASAVFGIFYWLRSNEQTGDLRVIAFFAVLIWTFLSTLNPFLDHETGFQGIVGRLDTFVYLQAAIAVPLSFTLFKPLSSLGKGLIAFPSTVLLVWSFMMPEPFGIQREFLNEREDLIDHLKETVHNFCENSLVMAPHGKQFVVTSVLGIPSQQRRPAKNAYQCTYWLIEEAGDGTKPQFHLVKDSEMRSTVGEMQGEDLTRFLAKNPHLSDL